MTSGLHVKIEQGPSSSMRAYGPFGEGWHWAIYYNDRFIAFSVLWYDSPRAAMHAAESLLHPDLPLYRAGKRVR